MESNPSLDIKIISIPSSEQHESKGGSRVSFSLDDIGDNNNNSLDYNLAINGEENKGNKSHAKLKREATNKKRQALRSRRDSLISSDGMMIRRRISVRDISEKSQNRRRHHKSTLKAELKNESQKQVKNDKKQYTLITERTARHTFKRLEQRLANSYIENIFSNILHWTFHTSMIEILLISFIWYTVQVLIYTGFFRLGLSIEPGCISPALKDGSTYFHVLFGLSWTTFSTVGYGNISPNIYSETRSCGFTSFLAFACSFHGIIFVGICSSIIFAKVLRSQNEAQVIFSDAILVHFGPGASLNESMHNLKLDASPPPVLTFRLINKHYDRIGSEIIHASLKCQVVTHNLESTSTFDDIKLTLSDLDLVMPHQALFKRVWLARHVIDVNSPLLSKKARKLIEKNDGVWPTHFNNAEKIRALLNFDQIIVTLTGTLNVSATDVFAHKTYNFYDLSVGYDFVNVIFGNEEESGIDVDIGLINDVVEQQGGGGEALELIED